MFKAVIFDCDGTLVDSEHAHYLGWQHAMRKHGVELPLEDLPLYVGKSTELNGQLLAKRVGKDCAHELITEKSAYYRNLQLAGLPPITATIEFVHELVKAKNVKLAVASAAKKEEILVNLRAVGIHNMFDIVLSGVEDLVEYSDPEGTNKPKPYIYLHTAKMLGVKPSECIVIEDSHTGVTAGVSAGCFTIAVPNAFSLAQNLSHAHLRIESFANIDHNTFFANNSASFKRWFGHDH